VRVLSQETSRGLLLMPLPFLRFIATRVRHVP
jgi:hypothetical protein